MDELMFTGLGGSKDEGIIGQILLWRERAQEKSGR
jgi:hypothetical protein